MKYLFFIIIIFKSGIVFSQNMDSIAILEEVDSLIRLNEKLITNSLFDEAISSIESAEKKVINYFGKNNATYALCLNIHGLTFSSKGQYNKAKLLFLEAKDIQAKVIGKNNPNYADILNNLGLLYINLNNYEEAESLLLESKSIRELCFGEYHKEVRASLQSLAFMYTEMQKYENAESYFIRAKVLYDKFNDKLNADYSSMLNNMGNMYKDIGRYSDAKKFYLEAISILEQAGEKNNTDYLMTYYNLGNLNKIMGDFEKSEMYYLHVKSIREKINNGETRGYANVLTALGILKVEMGQFREGELYLLQATNIIGKIYGKESVSYAGFIVNLGILYKRNNQYNLAEQYFLECKNIIESKLGIKNRQFANLISNLGSLYTRMNRLEEAKVLLINALQIDSLIGNGRENVQYLESLHNLGVVYERLGLVSEAESMYLESMSLREKIIGKNDLRYVENQQNLALFYWLTNRIVESKRLYLQSNENQKKLLTNATYHLSEQELLLFNLKFLKNLDKFLSFSQIYNDSKLTSACFNDILFYKSFLLTAKQQIGQLIYSDTNAVSKINLLNSYYYRLSLEYSKPLSKRDSLNVILLEDQANFLEKELVIKYARLSELKKEIIWEKVQETLGPSEVAIEFFDYKLFTKNLTDSINYAALVLLPNDTTPHFVPLFEEKEINQLLSNSQSRRMDYVVDVYHSPNDRGASPIKDQSKSLYELIWKPLEPYLKGVNKIYFSPSGLLHRINQNAVAINDKILLSDKYDLVQLSSTRQVVANKIVKEAKIHTACIYGGINFEMDSTTLLTSIHKMDTNSIALRSELSFSYTDSTLRGATWNYLKGSEDEANEINKIIQKTGVKSILFKGNEATEAGFKKLGDYKTESPQVIHISTHGYFFPDPKVNHQATIASLQQEPVFKMSEHPMLRSGLIMAGANHAWKTGKPITPEAEDGILTAYEISQLNLRNTELVVLSACETGLGDIHGNEGVYGLQRAFKIAGAKNLIMSLWQVPDKQTSELMTAFYKYWLIKKKSIRESLKLAQNDLRKKGLESFYWAGFVLVE